MQVLPSSFPRPRLARASHGLLPALLILGAVIWIYWPVRHGDWLWDDHWEVTDNPEVTGATTWGAIWLAPSQADYLPLKTTALRLVWMGFGSSPAVYHVLSIGLHALSALLVWRVFAALGQSRPWLAGLLFAVHPLAVESVAWVAELKNTLALPPLLLALLAYLAFLRRRDTRWYLLALACFAASLLCKASGVMLPVVLLLVPPWDWPSLRRRAVGLLPFFGVSLCVGLVTIHFQAARAIGDLSVARLGLAERVADAARAVAFYAAKFLFPARLTPLYPDWHAPWASLAPVLFGLAGLGLLLGWKKLPAAGRRAGAGLVFSP